MSGPRELLPFHSQQRLQMSWLRYTYKSLPFQARRQVPRSGLKVSGYPLTARGPLCGSRCTVSNDAVTAAAYAVLGTSLLRSGCCGSEMAL